MEEGKAEFLLQEILAELRKMNAEIARQGQEAQKTRAEQLEKAGRFLSETGKGLPSVFRGQFEKLVKEHGL